MNRYFALGIMAAIVLVGCQKEEIADNNQESVIFYATTEDSATKTSLDENRNVLWKQGDQVSIFNGSTVNERWQVTDASDGKTSADMNKVGSSIFSAGTDMDNNVAYYPYASAVTIAKNGGNYVIGNITLPATQNYAAGSFGNGAFPMAAVTGSTSDNNLKFKNVLGALKLQLKGTASITSVSVTGNSNEILCGPASVTASNGNTPTIALTDASARTVTLLCGAGISLNTTTATSFIIALPPMTMTGGFTVTVNDAAGKQMEIKTTKSQTITRSSILKMPEVTYTGTTTVTNLSESATANSYIVSAQGSYKIRTVKGNSAESVGTVARADVLWESYGTATAPSVGDLVSGVSYADGYITFSTSNKKGNAVIAAKDASGTILWSWHIWLTDKPADQDYNNDAGTMMDRNLGATSATPGAVQALGLLYQWGRKDPFLSGNSISSSTKAASTGSWPSAVSSTASTGTIAYATANPTTFIKYNSSNDDWHYTGSSSTDDTRWQTSKTIYDPCPAGYRVPDGEENGVWSKAFGTNNSWTNSTNWDNTNKGMNFGKTDWKLGSYSVIWYPSAGYLGSYDGSLGDVGDDGRYWSCTSGSYYAYLLRFSSSGYVSPSYYGSRRAYGQSVRCLQESK